MGRGCLSKGVHVYDLRDPRRPLQAYTFAAAASDPSLAGTWTEKVIVQRVNTSQFHGVRAAVQLRGLGPRR